MVQNHFICINKYKFCRKCIWFSSWNTPCYSFIDPFVCLFIGQQTKYQWQPDQKTSDLLLMSFCFLSCWLVTNSKLRDLARSRPFSILYGGLYHLSGCRLSGVACERGNWLKCMCFTVTELFCIHQAWHTHIQSRWTKMCMHTHINRTVFSWTHFVDLVTHSWCTSGHMLRPT